MVNAENAAVKNNRINLLGAIYKVLTGSAADISKLQKRG